VTQESTGCVLAAKPYDSKSEVLEGIILLAEIDGFLEALLGVSNISQEKRRHPQWKVGFVIESGASPTTSSK
jgi:hypothetical protein